jgi:hypothetical protein
VNVFTENLLGSRTVAEKIDSLVKSCEEFEELQRKTEINMTNGVARKFSETDPSTRSKKKSSGKSKAGINFILGDFTQKSLQKKLNFVNQ